MPGPWAPDGSGFYLVTDEGREFTGLAFFRPRRRRLRVGRDARGRRRGGRSLAGRPRARLDGQRGRLVAPPAARPRDRRGPTRAAAAGRHRAGLRRDGALRSAATAATPQFSGPPAAPGRAVRRRDGDGEGAPRHGQHRSAASASATSPRRSSSRSATWDDTRDRGLALPAEGARPHARRPLDPRRAGGAGAALVPAALPVPRQPRHRRARAEHPRLDRLRQDLPEADPPRLGRRRPEGLRARRPVPARAGLGRRRPDRRLRRLVRRLRDALLRHPPAGLLGAPRSTSSARATSSPSRRPCRRPGAGSWTSGSATRRPRSTS